MTSLSYQLSAEQEDQRIRRAQAEKQAKLERFRRDVKQRVRSLQRVKRQENLQESFHAVSKRGQGPGTISCLLCTFIS